MIDPGNIDPAHARARVAELDAQIASLKEQIKVLQRKRDPFMAAVHTADATEKKK